MINSLQSILLVLPYLSAVILMSTTVWAAWLITTLTRNKKAGINFAERKDWIFRKTY